MVIANGWHNSIREIEQLENDIRQNALQRREKMQELLRHVIENHQDGTCKVKFRPCHEKRLSELEVTTEFWMI